MPANTLYLSGDTTVFSNVSLFGGQLSARTVRVGGGPTLGPSAMDLRTNTVVVSLDTRANSDGMSIGQLRLVFLASGISLVYSSGSSVYVVGQSAQSAAQA